MSTRYMPSDLKRDVDRYNNYCNDAGLSVRYHYKPRNNYQAVDYSKSDEQRDQYTIENNVACGSSRTCRDAMADHYNNAVNYQRRRRLDKLEGTSIGIKTWITRDTNGNLRYNASVDLGDDDKLRAYAYDDGSHNESQHQQVAQKLCNRRFHTEPKVVRIACAYDGAYYWVVESV